MSSGHRFMPAAFAAIALVTASACVSAGGYYPARSSRTVDQRAYQYGFNNGRDHGIDDARARRTFDYDRHRDFRNADDGYRGYGDRSAYRSLFREGFVAGYSEGYRRFAYQGSRPGYGATPRRNVSLAAQNGYRDGFEQGRRDRADRRRADPVRASRYRSADDDYDRRDGSRDEYKRDYRAAFLQGYEAGYR